MLFYALELALRNGCLIQLSRNLTLRSVIIARPQCEHDEVVVQTSGRTIEEALALANENYTFLAQGVSGFRTDQPQVGSLMASGPLDNWILIGNSAWLEEIRDQVVLHLRAPRESWVTRANSISLAVANAFAQIQEDRSEIGPP